MSARATVGGSRLPSASRPGLTVSAWLPLAAPARADLRRQVEADVVRHVNAARGEEMRRRCASTWMWRGSRESRCALRRRGTVAYGRRWHDRRRSDPRSGKESIALGENLASSTGTREPAEAATNGWMASAGHRENIMRPDFTDTGVASPGRSHVLRDAAVPATARPR
jgi:hypothetical protein